MLKIYIYSYLNKIRSSRKIESECTRNTELMWLTCMLSPDFKTIADFRKDNGKSLKKIFQEFLKLCHKLELLSLKCVAIDGTKIRAKNSLDNVYRRKEIERIEEKIQEKIDKYVEELELNDKQEETDYEFLLKNLPEKLSKLKKSQDKVAVIKQIFKENPELDIFFANDTDSRYQKDNNRINAGYNSQTVVDEKNKLIIASEVTNESNDLHQLNVMKDKISELKSELGIKDKPVVIADAGYFNEREVIKADNDCTFEVYVSHPRDSYEQKRKFETKDEDKVPSKEYNKDKFKYNAEDDTFECPAGKKLSREGNGSIDKRNGVRIYQYKCNECKECPNIKLCTNDKKGRKIKATEYFKEITEFRAKCNSTTGKKIILKRKEIVEHPFGTIKHNWGYRYFMQKGQNKVSAEFSFIAFIYNLRRVLNIVSFETLMAAL